MATPNEIRLPTDGPATTALVARRHRGRWCLEVDGPDGSLTVPLETAVGALLAGPSSGATAPLEIERTFRVRAAPSVSVLRIRQGYLVTGPLSLRVRRAGPAATLTAKRGRGLVRAEAEQAVPAAVADRLLALSQPRVLTKDRGRIGRWEIDWFRDAYRGRITADVELTDPDEPLPAVPAGLVLGEEITDEAEQTNAALAAALDRNRR